MAGRGSAWQGKAGKGRGESAPSLGTMTIDQNKHVADNDDLVTKLAYVATVLRDAVVRYRVFEAHYRKQSKHEIRREDMVEANSTATQKALIDALALVEHASRLAADVARGVEDLDQRKDAGARAPASDAALDLDALRIET